MKDHQIDIGEYSVHTDLAREAHDCAVQQRGKASSIPGVHMEEWEEKGITTSWIRINEQAGADEIGKVPGVYLTLEIPDLRSKDSNLEQRVASHLADQFGKFLTEIGIQPNHKALIVGLGNWNVTPDALGPNVVKHSLVTRHLFQLEYEQVANGYRSVSALSPGVLGTTGIETSEIVHGVVEKSKPDFLIAIDSLASRALSRVYTTIQIADSGIHPGSGVGNNRKALNRETLGIPVIAIGIPTVVDAVTITHDTIHYVLAHLSREAAGVKNHPLDPHNRPSVKDLEQYQVPDQVKENMLGMLGKLDENEKRQLIQEILTPLGKNLIVTPKEVDSFVSDIAKLVANGINCALHEAVSMENIASHLH